MCNFRACFADLLPLRTPVEIRFGDDKTTSAQHYGTVSIGGLKLTALFVPDFRFSLLSLCQLDFAGFQALPEDVP